MAKPNLHTVAAHAGVSIATVSKVVNGVRYGIAEATLQRVLASINELGYRPNRSGRGLRMLRRSIIGMAIVDPSPTFLADPFTTNLVAGLSNYLSDRGFGLLLHGIKPKQVEASFLVKDQMIDWRRGEAWFWDTLVDADRAQNAGNWQWVAGSGADAAPYFRIFNPVTQSRKFDPDGAYIRRWVPELAKLDTKAIHAPWEAAPLDLAAAGVVLGKDYPMPILEHDEARKRALAAYEKIR